MFPPEVSSMTRVGLVIYEHNTTSTWHLRYGRLNIKGLRLSSEKQMVKGLPSIEEIGFCESCTYGKQTRQPFPSSQAWRVEWDLELVHVDLCGPMQTESLGCSKYLLLFTNNYNRMSWAYFIKCKSQTFGSFMGFKALVEKQK